MQTAGSEKEYQEYNTIFNTNCVPLCTFGCLHRCLQHKRLELHESVLKTEYYFFSLGNMYYIKEEDLKTHCALLRGVEVRI